MATAPSPSSTPTGEEADPSMDDILASIRRILNEDEKTAKPAADGVLVLDPSMMVDEGNGKEGESKVSEAHAEPAPVPAAGGLHLGAEDSLILAPIDDISREGPASPEPTFPPPAFPPPTVSREAPQAESPLVAPAAAAAAAHSVGSLVRTLAAERSALVTRGGLTIEDLVREEVRPVLKEWLDTHLPPLVERMVRAELERVVGRTV